MISVRVIGEISEDKAKTKDPTEKLNIGLISPLFFNSLSGSDQCKSEKIILQSLFFKFDVSTIF